MATHREAQRARDELNELEHEARAGAPDDWLAKEVHCSPALVRTWRREKGIRHLRGRPRDEEVRRFAMGLLGRPVPDVLMRTVSSSLKGSWEPPEYVLRREVNYQEMARLLHYLHRRGGFPLNKIAEALGYTYHTVEQAISVGDRIQEEENG